MKNLQLLGFIACVVLVLNTGTLNAKNQFKNGVYTGESRSNYTSEPFWGQVTLQIRNDSITLLTFLILDKDKNQVFGPDYEKYFKDNPVYIEQCRNEVKGIKTYTEAFLRTKSMEHLDAVTGATWSYNIFKDAMKATLEKARNN
jgi:major membrane immunogen (membrane-anchored lipoprotein)